MNETVSEAELRSGAPATNLSPTSAADNVQSIDNTDADQAVAPSERKHESTTNTGAKTELTMLEGMKVVFDEKVGLTPVQVVHSTAERSNNARH